MIRLVFSFLIFAAIVAAPPLILLYIGNGALLDPGFWKMYAFFFVLTPLVCFTVILGQQKDSKMGVQLFLSATVIKLLFCMIFALIYVLKKPTNHIHFILSFFYLYFLFTAFEVYTLLSNLRDQNKK